MEALPYKAIQQPAEVFQDVVTMRSDVNRIEKFNSITARSLARIEQSLPVRREVQEAMKGDNSTVQETVNDTNANALEEDLSLIHI